MVAGDHVDGACGRKVSLARKVGPLRDLDALDGFRDDEVRIGEALAVGVRRHVDGNAVDRQSEIGAVVRVESA